MRKLSVLMLVTIALLTNIGTAQAEPHSLKTIITWQKKQIAIEQQIIYTGIVVRSLAKVIHLKNNGVQQHRVYLHKLQKRLASNIHKLAHLRPAHYEGWMCIHQYEGAWGATNPNGHYNGLQMTMGWGELEGNPNNYEPMQILWAAEHEYQRNNYSRSWLQGQWGQTISPCWSYFE